MKKTVIATKDNPDLLQHLLIAHHEQSHVDFSNGCSIWLKDGGVFWGTDPYGQDFAVNSDDRWFDNVMSRLRYWDDDRDELGHIIK